jgi:hypothetical protein
LKVSNKNQHINKQKCPTKQQTKNQLDLLKVARYASELDPSLIVRAHTILKIKYINFTVTK